MSPDGTTGQFEGVAKMLDSTIKKAKVYTKGMEENTRWGHWVVVEDVKFADDGETPIECHKYITVNPGASLSLQMHWGRGETYIGLEGTTHVCVNGEIFELKEGDEIYIPRGALHFSWNESGESSKFHEIQAGPLCDEDDIKRSADKYKLANELDENNDVVQLMIKVCAERAQDGETPHNDADLLHIYNDYKHDEDRLLAEMTKRLEQVIQLHWDKTPALLPDFKNKVECKTCV